MTDKLATNSLEPLSRLARFSWDWAPHLCDPSHGCCDYHRCWSTVRFLELGGNLPAGIDFFRRELKQLISEDRKRVLISGAADTGILAMVAGIFQGVNVIPDLVFTDRCRTTLMQNRLFAEFMGLDIELCHCDIRELNCEPVDVVIAHSFLLFFPEPVRQMVINSWARILRPDGVVLMSNSISHDENVGPPAKDVEKVANRIPHLIEAARNSGMSEAQAIELGATADRFWRLNLSQAPYLTSENLQKGFDKAGLVLEKIETEREALAGPTRAFGMTNLPRKYAEMLVRKI